MTIVSDQPTLTSNPWVPAGVLTAGSVMVVLDTTIVNVALHDIGSELHASNGVEWVITAYLLAVCVSQPITGWLSNRFGPRRVFLVSTAAFTLASLGCAASPTLGVLVACRALQGFGGGAVIPVSMALILGLFPKERHGQALGGWSMAVMMTPAIGPTAGGLLVTKVSWHWLFLINAPVGFAVVLLGLRLLDPDTERARTPLDGPGVLLGSGGLALAVLGLSEGTRWGWSSLATVTSLVAGLGSLAAFVWWELRSDHPMIQLRMFSNKAFRLSMGAMLFISMAQFGRLVFIPLQLEDLRGFTALRVGLLLAPPAFAGMASTWIGGRLSDQVGPRRPIMLGCTAAIAALIGMSRLTLDTPLAWILVLLIVQTIGMGLVNAPSLMAGMSDLPEELVGQGTALRSLTGQVSGALAVAVFGAVVSSRMGSSPTPEHSQAAYNAAFVVAALGATLALIMASRLPGGRRDRARASALAHAAIME